jgi:glycine/D-amino acid oxidase-like deaminating enzyme
LRPFRPSGFVLRREELGPKTIIHNYGHGGCGVTLSWGTAHLAVEEALKTNQTKYAVLGCGAVGLATARLLQRRGFEVTIYAKDLPPNTTSNIAGALPIATSRTWSGITTEYAGLTSTCWASGRTEARASLRTYGSRRPLATYSTDHTL